MSDIDTLVAGAVAQHVPAHQPPFADLVARARRQRTRRRVGIAAGLVALLGVAAVPAMLGGGGHADRSTGPAPGGVASGSGQVPDQAPTFVPAPTRPAVSALAPTDATAVTLCEASGQCRTITDAAAVGQLANGLNAGEPNSMYVDCGDIDKSVITLTFHGPTEFTPVTAHIFCGWVGRAGDTARYRLVDPDAILQAHRTGRIVEDCGVTSGYHLGPEYEAAEFVGLTVDAALALAQERGLAVRLLGADGACYGGPVTDDLRLDRVNFYAERGRVVTARRF